MERVAPRQIMYENQLPLAIASKSQRRIFFAEGSSTYGPVDSAVSNIIRIPINADSLLDVQNSYLQFEVQGAVGANQIGFDFGVPIIERLRIESAGVTLEDIQSYNKLYGGVLLPAQASIGAVKDASISQMGVNTGNAQLTNLAAGAGGAAAGQIADSAVAGNAQGQIDTGIDALRDGIIAAFNTRTSTAFLGQHVGTNELVGQATKTYNFPLVSALMNLDKYLPLVFMNAGLVLEIHLGTGNSAGVGAVTANNAAANVDYRVRNVKYIAHLIDLEREFYDKMRMVMETSGSNLQLTGTTFRNFRSTLNLGAATGGSVNIPARVKSIKSIFFTFTTNVRRNSNAHYAIGSAIPCGVSEYQFRVGSMLYPSTAVKAGVANKGEAYLELRKAFGNLHDYQHGGALLDNTSYYSAADAQEGGALTEPQLTPYALDFESFPRTALENGINTADRSLPITLEFKQVGNQAGPADYDIDVFCMCDAVFFVNIDGSVSVSV